MERLAIVAPLKEGSEIRAKEILAQGAPFDLDETGIVRHAIYLSASEVVFVFEGHDVEWIVDGLIDQPFHPKLHDALDEWRAIVDGTPRIARVRFAWEHDEEQPAPTDAIGRSGP
jgi:hypothetical protein